MDACPRQPGCRPELIKVNYCHIKKRVKTVFIFDVRVMLVNDCGMSNQGQQRLGSLGGVDCVQTSTLVWL